MSQSAPGSPPSPAKLELATSAAADDARLAGESRQAAEAAATKAVAAHAAALAISKRLSRGKCYQNIQAGVAIVTLLVLIYQGYIINEQSKITEQQLRVASYTEELGIEQRLRDGTQAIQKLVYDKNGVFMQAREVSCLPMPADANKPSTEAEFKVIVSHYELYHKAATLRLIPRDRWRTICLNAKNLFDQNCLLETKLNQENNLDPEFRAAFIPKCELN